MKSVAAVLYVCLMGYAGIVFGSAGIDDPFLVSMEPCWNCLDDTSGSTGQFGGKWILIGNITFKKRSIKDSIQLQQLRLHWTGPYIEVLNASLYKKNFDPTKKEFLPIDEYLICDGVWHKTKQTLVLSFDEKQTLGALEVFYLVLTVPDSLEHILKEGSFSLEKEDLPVPFQQACKHTTLQLTCNVRG